MPVHLVPSESLTKSGTRSYWTLQNCTVASTICEQMRSPFTPVWCTACGVALAAHARSRAPACAPREIGPGAPVSTVHRNASLPMVKGTTYAPPLKCASSMHERARAARYASEVRLRHNSCRPIATSTGAACMRKSHARMWTDDGSGFVTKTSAKARVGRSGAAYRPPLVLSSSISHSNMSACCSCVAPMPISRMVHPGV